MTGSTHHIRGALVAPLHRSGWKLAALFAVLAVIGATSAAAGIIVPQRAEQFAATFDARAVGDPSITSCPALGEGGQKIEARYEGTFLPAELVPAEFMPAEFVPAEFRLEILFDRSAGVGTAEGDWQLVDPADRSIVARGEIIATVTADPPTEAQPPDPDLELHGLLIGLAQPPEPDMPAQRLLGNFSASFDEGATFPHLRGSVGDPSVGDPSAPNPAVLLPAIKC